MANDGNDDIQINAKNITIVSAISVAYLLLSYFLVGYKSDQLVLLSIFNLCFYATGTTRRFILGFSIFIVYWIIFDYMKAFPNYNYNDVAIGELYNTEKKLFGIKVNNTLLTPNEYLYLKRTSFVDIFSGLFYLCWIPVPLAFAAYLLTYLRLYIQRAQTYLLLCRHCIHPIR
jgi:hypothetical protein